MFKYTESFVADLLFKENRIRIGTLNGFRDMESKQGISDPLEGSYDDHVIINGTEKDYFNNPIFRENLKGLIHIEDSCSNITITNCTSLTKRVSQNFLIFCCADKESSDLFKQFDRADTCFTISKPHRFFTLITWALEKEFNCAVDFLGVHKISYQPYTRKRSAFDSLNIHPALAKTEEFRPQCELRAIWQVPQDLITKPFYDLQVSGLKKTCSLINFE